MRRIYLDYSATTPIARPVQEAMLPFLAEHYGNPASPHPLGRAAQEAVEDARVLVARLLGADRDEIVFTSGGTESNNLAIVGTMLKNGPAASGHLVISAIEHASVAEPARFLETLGYDLTIVGCDQQGRVDPADIEAAIRPTTVLVSVMHANHEIGTIQPIRQIAQICHARGVLMHTDASQTVGQVPVRVQDLGVDLLSLSGHKMYAPKGIGALYVRRGTRLEPLLHGEGNEAGLRSGTGNIPGIVALGRAASLAAEDLNEVASRMALLRDHLEWLLIEGTGSSVSINGHPSERLPNLLSISFPGVNAGDLLRRTSEVCASTGGASPTGEDFLSPTLAALGLTGAAVRSTLRLSVGWFTTDDEIQRAANLLLAAWEGMK